MLNAILFKNGELEVKKSLQEVMQDTRTQAQAQAIIPVANFSKSAFSLKSLDCHFHFVKDCVQYARFVECAYFMGAIKAMNSKANTLEEKELEEGLTQEQGEELKELEETISLFENILEQCYTPQEQAFSNADKLIKFISVYFSKDTSCYSNFTGFIAFFNNLVDDKPVQVLKPLLEKVLNTFTVEEDDIYYNYHFHANTELVDDCRRVYYKGRRISKGKSVKTFDKEGKSIKQEIILAVIENLQKKSRKAYEEEEAKHQAEAEKKAKAQAQAQAQAKKEEQATKQAKAQAQAKKEKADK